MNCGELYQTVGCMSWYGSALFLEANKQCLLLPQCFQLYLIVEPTFIEIFQNIVNMNTMPCCLPWQRDTKESLISCLSVAVWPTDILEGDTMGTHINLSTRVLAYLTAFLGPWQLNTCMICIILSSPEHKLLKVRLYDTCMSGAPKYALSSTTHLPTFTKLNRNFTVMALS